MDRPLKEVYEFGPFRLNVGERVLERTDGIANGSLPEKAFLTLVVLLRDPGRLISKNELISTVWPDAAVEDNSLDKSIHAIRQALGDSAREPRYIETVRKHGYRFVAPVRTLSAEERAERPESPTALGITPAATELGEPGASAMVHPEQAYSSGSPTGDAEGQQQAAELPTAVALVVLAAMIFVIAGFLTGLFRGGGPRVGQGSAAGDRSPAYDLYIRGKVKVAAENRAETEDAVRVLEEAVALDPGFAPAFAQLARAYNTIAFKYASADERKIYHENAEVAIEKALALDPNLAEAHFARGLVLWSHLEGFPHEQVVRSYKRSLELDPDIDETHHQLSLVYSHIGMADEALRSVERALELNPTNTLARYRSGVYAQYQGRFEDSLTVHKTIPRDFTPLLVERTKAEVLIQLGRAGEAARIVDEYLEKFPQDEGGSLTSVRALLLAKEGKIREAEGSIGRAIEIGSGFGHFHHTTYNIASAYAAMNRPAEAVEWLEHTAENGFPNYPYFEVDPNLDTLRSDERFIEFMARLKPQWERLRSVSGSIDPVGMSVGGPGSSRR